MQPVDWQRTRVVVFDVDGTLYDARCIRRSMAAALLAHCLRRPRELPLLRLLGRFRRDRERLAEREAEGIRRLQYEGPAEALGIDPSRVRAAVEEWMERRPLPRLARCRFPGVEPLFARLRSSGRTVAVLSDYPAAAKLEALGLAADLVVTAVDPEIDRLKPHPAGLARILDLTGAPPEACLSIGDRDRRDGEAARRLGVPYRLKVRRPGGSALEFSSYSELLADLPG